MANGPFPSYAPPNVYTTTIAAQSLNGPPAGIQIPVIMGVGQETLTSTDLELVRGSSSTVDQSIQNENVSGRAVLDNTNPTNPVLGEADGATSLFRVQNYPLVVGDGQGLTTNRPQDVQAFVDGVAVVVARVDGERGIVQLQVAPPEGATVTLSYFFNRTDTLVTNDVSDQVSSSPATLQAPFPGAYVIVSGQNDVLSLRVNGVNQAITLTSGTVSASDVAVDISVNQIEGLTASSDIDNQGRERLVLSATGSLEILSGSANGLFGYNAGDVALRNRDFVVFETPIVDGSNGGIVTTNPSDVTVRIDGQIVPVESVVGSTGTVTLANAPVVGSTVEVSYFFNSFQNTFDYLPNTGVRSISALGNAPGRVDYIQGLDYILQDDRILWGSALTISAGRSTAGSEVFDDSQVTATLVDSRIYLESVSRIQDTTVSPARPSNFIVALGNVPTQGDGRDTATSNPALVDIYHGPTLQAALIAGKRTVVDVNPSTRQVRLKDAIPAGDMVWASYYYSRLQDDLYTLSKDASGRFRVNSQLRGENLYNVRFGTSTSVDTIQFPGGVQSNPDAFYLGADGVNETVTVTFTSVGGEVASYTNALPGPYDIFANASDTLHLILNDGSRGVTNDAVTVDLSTPAFAVLFGAKQEAAASYVVTTGINDVFAFTLDETNYSVTLPSGTLTIEQVADAVNRIAPSEASVTGTLTETFDFSVARSYDVTINGTNVTGSVTGTATDSATDVAAAWITAIQTDSGTLTGGDLTVPGNDFNVVANPDGTVTLEASRSLQINDAGGASDFEDILGLATGAVITNTRIMRTWEGTDHDYFALRSRTLPTLASSVSRVRILNGSANELLGFEPFQESFGTVSAVNKGATLLSTAITPTMITNLEALEEDFVVSVDGVEYTVDGSAFDTAASVADLVTAIDAVIGLAGADVAKVTEEAGGIRLLSNSVDNTSSLEIGQGAANSYLGFTEGDSASQRRPSAGDVVSVLNNTSAAWADESDVDLAALVASGEVLNGVYAVEFEVSGAGSFIQVNSFNTGIDTSVTFDDGTDTVLNDTGIGIEDGDTASGTEGQDGFTVASSNPEGSAGTGRVGQTYTDAVTGLRFTVLAATDGAYTVGQGFTLIAEEQMLTGSSVVNKALPGVNLIVTSLTNIADGDTALVETYSKSGSEPGVGDFYYVTYDYEKDDFSTQFYTRFIDVQNNYGALSPENPLTMGAYLTLLNGASVVAGKQIRKPEGLQQAPASSFIAGLDELRRPLAGGARPDLIVPMTTDTSVFAEVTRFCEIQSTPRNRNECRALFGTASGTRPADAQALARGLKSRRALLVYPDSALLTTTNELGVNTTFIVDGTFMAAALAGVIVSPANDVATPLTRQRLVGFDRLNRSLDEIEMNNLAVAGVTVLQDESPFLVVRQGLTTDVSNRLTSIPSIVAIQDFVQQQARAALSRFIGLKFLRGRAQDVELALTGLLNTLVENNIITAFTGVSATPDPNDPTLLNVEAFYSPIFPILYIDLKFTISSSI